MANVMPMKTSVMTSGDRALGTTPRGMLGKPRPGSGPLWILTVVTDVQYSGQVGCTAGQGASVWLGAGEPVRACVCVCARVLMPQTSPGTT